MTLQQLRYVAEIADKGSMSEAAKSMYVSQPTLSGTIRELETELGFQIFVRNNRGMMLSPDGLEFLSYARSVLNQMDTMQRRYFSEREQKASLTISSQHYGFVTDCFLDLVKQLDPDSYNFSVKEEPTAEIISDIKGFRSEIGILYVNSKTEKMMLRYLKENHMEFSALCTARPHVLLKAEDPLASSAELHLEQLADYTYLYFDQKDTDPIYFSEEILSSLDRKKKIAVTDRATIFSLLNDLKAFTVTTGMTSGGAVEGSVASIPLVLDVSMKVGYIKRENSVLSPIAQQYIEMLTEKLKAVDASIE